MRLSNRIMFVKLFILSLLLFTTCKKEPKEFEPPVLPKATFEIIKQGKVKEGISMNGFRMEIDGDNILVMTTDRNGASPFNQGLYAVNKNSLELSWEWKEDADLGNFTGFHNHTFFITSHISGKLYAIDTKTGSPKWVRSNTEPDFKFYRFYRHLILDDYLFLAAKKGNRHAQNDTAIVSQIHISTGKSKRRAAFATKDFNNFSLGIHRITPWYYQGDTLLVMQASGTNWSNNHSSRNCIIYNITADSMYWDASKYLRDWSSFLHVMDGDDAILFNGNQNIKLDLKEKKVIWNHKIEIEETHGHDYYLDELRNQVIVGPGNIGFVKAFDIATGKLNWSIEAGSEKNLTQMYGDEKYVYFCNAGGFWQIELASGKVRLKINQKDLSPVSFTGMLAWDKSTGYFYFCNQRDDIYCVKILED